MLKNKKFPYSIDNARQIRIHTRNDAVILIPELNCCQEKKKTETPTAC